MIFDQFPTATEFYQTYWNKKPFVVRGGVPKDVFDTLIDGDTLAGLSLEDDIKSRLILTHENGAPYTCEHGPLAADRFESLGDKNWSLLVQNVEQYHTQTATLLPYFDVAPRWLMDDIMVSYSTPSGGVGPHTDSYHVFLVQGIGTRKWRIGNAPITNQDLIDGLDLKVLKDGVDGDEITVSMGDVIYIPPHFAHEGITVDNAMTFSVGFLGPKLSDLMIEYGHYLAQNDTRDVRYCGQDLTPSGAGFTIDTATQSAVQNLMSDAIRGDDFASWLAEYFSAPTHDEYGDEISDIHADDVLNRLQSGETLRRPEHIKIVMTAQNDAVHIYAHGRHITVLARGHVALNWLNTGHAIGIENIKNNKDLLSAAALLCAHNILSFENDD